MNNRNTIRLLRVLEETIRDQSAYARQRNLDKPGGELSGEILYSLSQAVLTARIQLEREQLKRRWFRIWPWM